MSSTPLIFLPAWTPRATVDLATCILENIVDGEPHWPAVNGRMTALGHRYSRAEIKDHFASTRSVLVNGYICVDDILRQAKAACRHSSRTSHTVSPSLSNLSSPSGSSAADIIWPSIERDDSEEMERAVKREPLSSDCDSESDGHGKARSVSGSEYEDGTSDCHHEDCDGDDANNDHDHGGDKELSSSLPPPKCRPVRSRFCLAYPPSSLSPPPGLSAVPSLVSSSQTRDTHDRSSVEVIYCPLRVSPVPVGPDDGRTDEQRYGVLARIMNPQRVRDSFLQARLDARAYWARRHLALGYTPESFDQTLCMW